MLRNLLLRDWILNRRALLASLGIFSLFQIYFVLRTDSARAWLVFSAIYAAFLTLAPSGRDDKFRATAWACTLPVSRRDLVRGRYAGALLLAALAMALAVGMAALIPGSRVSLPDLADPATLFLAAAAITLIVALMTPFTIRFGIMGVMVFLVAMQVLGAALLLVLIATGGRHEAGGSNPIRRAIGGAIDGLVALREALSPPLFYLAVAAVLVGIAWLGYRLTAALFLRREL